MSKIKILLCRINPATQAIVLIIVRRLTLSAFYNFFEYIYIYIYIYIYMYVMLGSLGARAPQV